MTIDSSKPLLSIALVADLHCAPITVGNRHCSESLGKLQAAVKALETKEPDLIICLGDMIDKSETIEEELSCIREVKDCLNTLPAEKHFLIGNHDVSELTKKQYMSACGTAAPYYSFDYKGVHIVILDSNFNDDGSSFGPGNINGKGYWVSQEQILWLKDDLTSSEETPALVFCHANLDHRIRRDGKLNGHIVKNAAELREIFETTGNVRAVIQGHDHGGVQQTINGIPYITLHAMVEGSGLEQNAFGILSLYENNRSYLQGFGRQPSLEIDMTGNVKLVPQPLFMSPPVVMHADENGFTVSIELSQLCTGRVEWGFSENELIHSVIPVYGGLAYAHKHCLVIPVAFEKAIEAGQPIYYRVSGEALTYSNAYDINRGSTVYTSVRKIILSYGEDSSVSMGVINDTHDRQRTLPSLSKLIEKEKPDLLVWNGDVCREFNKDDLPHDILLRPGANGPTPSCGGWASSRPLLYVPGNHDVRGERASELSSIFPPGKVSDLPHNKAIRFGPLAIITLDAGEDKPDHHPIFAGTAAYEPYRELQAKWLATQLCRPEIANAPFKISFSHIPLRGLPGQDDGSTLEGGARYSGQGAKLWLPQLIAANFHAIISGHTHEPRYDQPTKEQPITQIVGGGPSPDLATLIVIEATTSTLNICTKDLEGRILAKKTWTNNSKNSS